MKFFPRTCIPPLALSTLHDLNDTDRVPLIKRNTTQSVVSHQMLLELHSLTNVTGTTLRGSSRELLKVNAPP